MGPERDTHGEIVKAATASRYFSVALDLRGRRCLVVGGGAIAASKARALLDAGSRVVLVAPEIAPEVEALRHFSATEPEARVAIELLRRPFAPTDLDDVFLVMAATEDPALTEHVAREARARGVLINAADDPAHCDFILPAVLRRGEIQIGISTGGQSPALARHLRERLEREIPAEYGPLAEALASVREELRQAGTKVTPEAWQQAITGDVLSTLRQGDTRAAIHQIRATLLNAETEKPPPSDPLPFASATPAGPSAPSRPDEESGPANRHPNEAEHNVTFTANDRDMDRESDPPITDGDAADSQSIRKGRILLVGAGPGDPGLITVAGHRAIAEADVIVYDRLINPALLDVARHDARLIFAGKSRGGGPLSQAEINDAICMEARAGNMVVRLKGGDPFVFGRGGEEALAAVEAGVPFTVIPGISAAVAAPAYAGIPVTHRGLASAFTVLTGHEDPSKASESVDWELLARFGGTLVLLMGVNTLPAITQRLVENGLAPHTPAAVIEGGTLDRQRLVTGTVADIADRAQAAAIKAPATTVIGGVVGLADILGWWQTACMEPGLP